MVDLFGRKWASQLKNTLSGRFITDRQRSSVFILMCRAEAANGVRPTNKDSHMVKAWSYIGRKNGNTVGQEDAMRDGINEKIEEVRARLLQRRIDNYVMIQAHVRRYLSQKLFRSLLLLSREEVDNEITMTFIYDDNTPTNVDYPQKRSLYTALGEDNNKPTDADSQQKRSQYTALSEDKFKEQIVDEFGVMRKSVAKILMAVLKG